MTTVMVDGDGDKDVVVDDNVVVGDGNGAMDDGNIDGNVDGNGDGDGVDAMDNDGQRWQ